MGEPVRCANCDRLKRDLKRTIKKAVDLYPCSDDLKRELKALFFGGIIRFPEDKLTARVEKLEREASDYRINWYIAETRIQQARKFFKEWTASRSRDNWAGPRDCRSLDTGWWIGMEGFLFGYVEPDEDAAKNSTIVQDYERQLSEVRAAYERELKRKDDEIAKEKIRGDNFERMAEEFSGLWDRVSEGARSDEETACDEIERLLRVAKRSAS